MSHLSTALDYTLVWEGGFVDDPDDPGGRTKFGITERDHPEVWEDGPPTEQDALRIYRQDYWDRIGADQIADHKVATYAFDTCVNQGPRVAATVAQQAAVLLGEHLHVDGAFGPKTRAALNRLDPDRLIHVMVAYRANHYRMLAESRERFRKYIYGWLRRAYAILEWDS